MDVPCCEYLGMRVMDRSKTANNAIPAVSRTVLAMSHGRAAPLISGAKALAAIPVPRIDPEAVQGSGRVGFTSGHPGSSH